MEAIVGIVRSTRSISIHGIVCTLTLDAILGTHFYARVSCLGPGGLCAVTNDIALDGGTPPCVRKWHRDGPLLEFQSPRHDDALPTRIYRLGVWFRSHKPCLPLPQSDTILTLIPRIHARDRYSMRGPVVPSRAQPVDFWYRHGHRGVPLRRTTVDGICGLLTTQGVVLTLH